MTNDQICITVKEGTKKYVLSFKVSCNTKFVQIDVYHDEVFDHGLLKVILPTNEVHWGLEPTVENFIISENVKHKIASAVKMKVFW